MSVEPVSATVLGVGNVLLGDDGVGVRVVEELSRAAERDPGALPSGTRLVDAGTLGVDALSAATGSGWVIVVDAVDLGLPPGTVRVLRDREVDTAAGWTIDADAGVGGLLAAGRLAGWVPRSVALVGIQVADISPGTRLSDDVEAAVARAAATVRLEVRAMRGSA